MHSGRKHDASLCDAIVCLVRKHAYGDIYSSPGLDLRQKQLLGSAFLVCLPVSDCLWHALLHILNGKTVAGTLQKEG